MSTEWSVEPPSRGPGTWFVGRSTAEVTVIAGPGTPLPGVGGGTPAPAATGWRLATWHRATDRQINLDHDRPDHFTPVASVDVIRRIDPRLHGHARQVLLEQVALLAALHFGPELASDPKFEVASQRRREAIAWARSELVSAFPHDYAELHDPEALISGSSQVFAATQPIPDTADELIAAIPAGSTVIDHNFGCKDLLRLLKRRLMWRFVEGRSRWSLVLLYAFGDHEFHQLVERRLKEQSVEADWPPVPDLRHVEGGRPREMLAIWRGAD